MEALGRVELPTNGLGNRCSIHLSYGAIARLRHYLTWNLEGHEQDAVKSAGGLGFRLRCLATLADESDIYCDAILERTHFV